MEEPRRGHMDSLWAHHSTYTWEIRVAHKSNRSRVMIWHTLQILHQSRRCLPAYIITSINNASFSGRQGWADENYELLWSGTSPVCTCRHTRSSRPYSSIFAYCKWLKTRSGKGLGMRPVQWHNIANIIPTQQLLALALVLVNCRS